MVSSDDWFSKSLLINSINQNSVLKQKVGKALLEGNDSFTDILNQMMADTVEQALEGNKNNTKSFSPTVLPMQNRPLITYNQDPLQYIQVSADKLNKTLKGALKNMGETYIEAAQHYNINPVLLAAISMHETGNGTSVAANQKNNVAGMMGKGGLKSYSSIKDSIWDMARNLSENYLGKGISSIAQIGAKYAPVGADNDPTGLNNYWVSGVSRFFNQLNA